MIFNFLLIFADNVNDLIPDFIWKAGFNVVQISKLIKASIGTCH